VTTEDLRDKLADIIERLDYAWSVRHLSEHQSDFDAVLAELKAFVAKTVLRDSVTYADACHETNCFDPDVLVDVATEICFELLLEAGDLDESRSDVFNLNKIRQPKDTFSSAETEAQEREYDVADRSLHAFVQKRLGY
jgi:hypothetical protein